MRSYEYYKIYNVTDKDIIEKLIALDDNKTLNAKDYSTLRVEIDLLEKDAVIYTDELIIHIDYKKTKELLNELEKYKAYL